MAGEQRNHFGHVGAVYKAADPVLKSGYVCLSPSRTLGAIINDRMVTELDAIIEALGGEAAVGRSLHSEADIREAIREGFPHAVVDAVMSSAGLSLKDLSDSLNLSPRSLQRRAHEGRLARHESDRIYRMARIVALANRYIGDRGRAAHWLRRSNRALGGNSPLELLDTEPGAKAVENVLGRIAYGGIS